LQIGNLLAQAFTEAGTQAVGEVVSVIFAAVFRQRGPRKKSRTAIKKVARHGHSPPEMRAIMPVRMRATVNCFSQAQNIFASLQRNAFDTVKMP
jgi:hypothetical protein